MSVKSTVKKSPRAMPVETIITRYKSAQQKLKIDKESTKATSKSKLKHKSERKLKNKPQTKQIEIEKKRHKKKEEETTREFYPEKLKRKTSSKKIVLMPKHCFKLIGGTNGCNKRKMRVPRKEIAKRVEHVSRSSTPSELDDSPKHKPQELSIKDMVLLIEEQGGLGEEDLLEILTCPSPVWWEDPPAGYVEDPILTRPRSAERKSVKNQLIEEQIKEAERKKKIEAKAKSASTNVNDVKARYLDITSLDVSVRNRDVNFMNKRCKLESLLGCIKNKVKICDSKIQRNNDVAVNSSNTFRRKLNVNKASEKTDKTNVVSIDAVKEIKTDAEDDSRRKRNSDSFEEDSILHLDDEGILSFENINIPIAPNGMLANKSDTAVAKTGTNAACRKKGSNTKTKSENDVYRKRFRENKSLLRPEYSKSKRIKKDTLAVKIKNPISNNRIKIRSKGKKKDTKMNALPVKIEDNISNDTVSKIKEHYILDVDNNSKNGTVNEIDRIFIKVEDHILKYSVNENEESRKKNKNISSKDFDIEKPFIKNTSVRDTLREIKEIPVKIEDTSKDNVAETEEVPITNNSISYNTTREYKGTVIDIKDDNINHDLSEIKETGIKMKDNISQSASGIDKSIEIIDVLSDDEIDFDTSSVKLENSNSYSDSNEKDYEDHTRRVSVDSDVSDRNMSEEYLDMSVFDDEDQKIEFNYQNSVYTELPQSDVVKLPKASRSVKRPNKIEKSVNNNTEPDTDGQNIFDDIGESKFNEINIYNANEHVEDEKQYFGGNSAVVTEDIEKLPVPEHKSTEYVEVYKIISSDSDNDMNSIQHKEIVDKNNDDSNRTGAIKHDKFDRQLNFYYKQRKIINKPNDKRKYQIKDVKVERDCDRNLKKKSVLVSDNGVKYCLVCSSIFDTESCKYCIEKLKNRCACPNLSQYVCNICNAVVNSRDAIIRHINGHKTE